MERRNACNVSGLMTHHTATENVANARKMARTGATDCGIKYLSRNK